MAADRLALGGEHEQDSVAFMPEAQDTREVTTNKSLVLFQPKPAKSMQCRTVDESKFWAQHVKPYLGGAL